MKHDLKKNFIVEVKKLYFTFFFPAVVICA